MTHLRLFNILCRCCRWLVRFCTQPEPGGNRKSHGRNQFAGGAYLLQVLGSLILVFGAIFGVLFLLKKSTGCPYPTQVRFVSWPPAGLVHARKSYCLKPGSSSYWWVLLPVVYVHSMYWISQSWTVRHLQVTTGVLLRCWVRRCKGGTRNELVSLAGDPGFAVVA